VDMGFAAETLGSGHERSYPISGWLSISRSSN
jgi:hypothetical protein